MSVYVRIRNGCLTLRLNKKLFKFSVSTNFLHSVKFVLRYVVCVYKYDKAGRWVRTH